MPIHFTVDEVKRAVFTTATGIVSCDEILDHLVAKASVGAASFHELFDARQVILDISSADLVVIAKGVSDSLGDEAHGKNAVVTDSAMIYGLAKTYADLTGKDASDFQVFEDLDEARESLLG
jgi:hypothetical protein